MLDVVVGDGPVPSRGSGRTVNVWRDDDRRAFAEAAVHGRGYRLEWQGIGVLTFEPDSLRVHLWPAAGVDEAEAVSAVLHVVQPVILQSLGYQTVHASAIQLTTGIVAFCGVSGSGKSTMAFALGRLPGVSQIADDALVVEATAAGIVAQPLPFRARLRPESGAFFGEPSSPRPGVLARRTAAAPLLAIFVLKQSTEAKTIDLSRVGPTHAFSVLLTHAHCFDETDRETMASMVHAYLSIAASVPVYSLVYPRDFAHLEALRACVLNTIAPAASVNHAAD